MREKSVRELQGWEPACSSSSSPLPSSSPYSSSCSPMGPCGFMACLTTPALMSPAPPLSPFPNDCRRPWTTRGHASLRSRLLGSFCGMCVCVCVHCRLALALPGPSAQELGQGSETQQVRKEMREKQLRAQVKAKVGVMNNVELTSALH